jgi:hypothetical protein
MFGISFNLISYTGIRIGPSVTGIGVITPKGSPLLQNLRSYLSHGKIRQRIQRFSLY